MLKKYQPKNKNDYQPGNGIGFKFNIYGEKLTDKSFMKKTPKYLSGAEGVTAQQEVRYLKRKYLWISEEIRKYELYGNTEYDR